MVSATPLLGTFFEGVSAKMGLEACTSQVTLFIAVTQDRTGDLQIFSLTLSQLSYRGLCHGIACARHGTIIRWIAFGVGSTEAVATQNCRSTIMCIAAHDIVLPLSRGWHSTALHDGARLVAVGERQLLDECHTPGRRETERRAREVRALELCALMRRALERCTAGGHRGNGTR